MRLTRVLGGLFAGMALSVSMVSAADWPMFRGPDRNGVSTETTAPLEWSATKNVKWKTPLPRPGNSSPIVVGEHVFLTTAQDAKGTQRSLMCFSRADGKVLWTKTVAFDTPDPTHATNPYCASTPAADDKHVIAWHGSAGLYCYDHDGKELWKKDLGVVRHIWGYAGSPVIHGDVVFLNVGPGERQSVVALNKNTGETIWQTEEPGGAEDKSPQTGGWLGSWNTPVITKVGEQKQVLVFMPFRVNAYDPKTGKILWTVGGQKEGTGPLAYQDAVLAPPQADGSRIGIAMAGYGGAAIGFKLGGDGDMTAKNRLWRNTDKNPQRIGSGIVVGQHIYVPNEPYLGCYDITTGKEVWKANIPNGERFWGSIVKVGDRMYVTSQKGTTFVFTPDPSGYKQLAANPLGEASNSTPAVSNGQLFIRTAGHLWCIEESK